MEFAVVVDDGHIVVELVFFDEVVELLSHGGVGHDCTPKFIPPRWDNPT